MTQGPLTLAHAKQQADRLIARLGELGITLKRTQALEGIAAIHDAGDWNRLSAKLKTGAHDFQKAFGLSQAEVATLKTTGSNQSPIKALIARPGAGKTTALTLHLLAHLESNDPGLAVWVMPRALNTSPQQACLIPDAFASQVQFVSVPFYGLDTLRVEIEPPKVDSTARALVITLEPADILSGKPDSEVASRQMRQCRGAAIALALDHVASTVQQQEISLLLIDEGHLIEFSEGQLLMTRSSIGKSARGVIASQIFDFWMKDVDFILPEGEGPYYNKSEALLVLPDPRRVFMANTRHPAEHFDTQLPYAHQTHMFAAISPNISAQTRTESWDLNGIPVGISTLCSVLREHILSIRKVES